MEVAEVKTIAGKVFGMPDEEIASTFFEGEGDAVKVKSDAVDLLLARDIARIAKINETHVGELTKIHDKGYQTAQAESLTKWEEKLKLDYGYTGTEKGKALVDAIAKKISTAGKDPKLSEDYIQLERKFNESETAWKTRMEEEVEKVKTEFSKTERLHSAQGDALKHLTTNLKPASLAVNETVRATQLKNFLSEFSQFDFEKDQTGEYIISKDGKRLDDEHGKPYKFNDLVAKIANSHFEFAKQEPRAPGAPPAPGGNEGAVTLPETYKEFMQMVAEEKDPLKNKALWVAWETRHPETK